MVTAAMALMLVETVLRRKKTRDQPAGGVSAAVLTNPLQSAMRKSPQSSTVGTRQEKSGNAGKVSENIQDKIRHVL